MVATRHMFHSIFAYNFSHLSVFTFLFNSLSLQAEQYAVIFVKGLCSQLAQQDIRMSTSGSSLKSLFAPAFSEHWIRAVSLYCLIDDKKIS